MTDDHLAEWRKALAAHAKAARRQRGKRRKPHTKAGMIRKPPPSPKEDPCA
jgi:hypothetical protein